jgi:hypothetical protein
MTTRPKECPSRPTPTVEAIELIVISLCGVSENWIAFAIRELAVRQ